VPTYQYACTECGSALEAQQSFTDAALTTCPQCAGRLRKVFSAVGVVFKGSGFYRNDSRPAEKSDAAASADSGAKADAASDSKAAGASSGTNGTGPSDSSGTSGTSSKNNVGGARSKSTQSSKSSSDSAA